VRPLMLLHIVARDRSRCSASSLELISLRRSAFARRSDLSNSRRECNSMS